MNMGPFPGLQGSQLLQAPPPALTELRGVNIDKNKPIRERLRDYISVLGNPYIFRVGDVAVKVNFNPNGKSLSEAMTDILLAG